MWGCPGFYMHVSDPNSVLYSCMVNTLYTQPSHQRLMVSVTCKSTQGLAFQTPWTHLPLCLPLFTWLQSLSCYSLKMHLLPCLWTCGSGWIEWKLFPSVLMDHTIIAFSHFSPCALRLFLILFFLQGLKNFTCYFFPVTYNLLWSLVCPLPYS